MWLFEKDIYSGHKTKSIDFNNNMFFCQCIRGKFLCQLESRITFSLLFVLHCVGVCVGMFVYCRRQLFVRTFVCLFLFCNFNTQGSHKFQKGATKQWQEQQQQQNNMQQQQEKQKWEKAKQLTGAIEKLLLCPGR